MSSLFNLYSFLDHSFSPNDEDNLFNIRQLTSGDLHIPNYEVPFRRNVITGELEEIDFCSSAYSCKSVYDEPDFENRKVDASILRSVAELRTVLCDQLKEQSNFTLNSLSSEAYDINESATIAKTYDNLICEEVFNSWCSFTRSQAEPSVMSNPVVHARSSLFATAVKSRKTYAISEDTAQQLPPLTDLIPNPAFTWEFELDTFQKQAILCLERNQNVFVAAHTSAGKTVVAEYACALCRRRGSRVIYTSPIKALSNQKFYDFKRTFKTDVGLITGDIKLSPESTLLIMTTEILYNMLCTSADTIRDLEIVIMDEVHYVNDAERGHVWEQIMIMLPKHILLVMLSATVPNKLDFADWLGRIRDKEIHVVATNKRPVPLEHYLYTGMSERNVKDQLNLIVDRDNQFNRSGYKKAETMLIGNKSATCAKVKEPINDSNKNQRWKQTGGKVNTPGRHLQSNTITAHDNRTKNMWLGVVRMLQERNLMPAIAFTFSRSSLEAFALHLGSVDLLDASEKREVKQFLHYSVTRRLKKADRQLESVLFVTRLTSRGIAIHHAGMLPILKETVEMLFQRGLVRLLFATETFAMGVNMPARCVLFTSLEKYDGYKLRSLNPSEYTQMAGRAGRRGLDSAGAVIILVSGIGKSVTSATSSLPSEYALTEIIMGKQTQLVSKFKVTYSMILHLHRTNGLTPQDLIRRSFMEAAGLRRELDRRHWHAALCKKLKTTTNLIPSAGSSMSTGRVVYSDNRKSLSRVDKNSSQLSVPFGEPVMIVRCPADPDSDCADAMATYYQACCNFRQLRATVSRLLADENVTDLQRVLCTGRIIFIHLQPHTTTKANRSGRCLRNRNPDWIVPAVIVDLVKKAVKGQTELLWNLITWQLPTYSTYYNVDDTDQSRVSTADPSDRLAAEEEEEEEEEILCEGEDVSLSATPFPPQLMPLYKPDSLDDGFRRLHFISDSSPCLLVRLCQEVINLKPFSGTPNVNMSVSDMLIKAIKHHRRQLAASQAGVELVLGANSDSGMDCTTLLNNINKALFDLIDPIIPDSNKIGMCTYGPHFYGLPQTIPEKLDLSKVFKFKAHTHEDTSIFDELSLLADELTSPFTGSEVRKCLGPVNCPDLVTHFRMVHQTCRRRWAVRRIEDSLSDNQLQLNTEYLGRLRVLEELGFIDSATQNGCLTLKGRVACELSKMEVLLTQLLFDGSLNQLTAADIAAVASCFVFELRPSDLQQNNVGEYEYLIELLSCCTSSSPAINSVDNPPICNSTADSALPHLPRHLQPLFKSMLTSALKLQQLQMKYGLLDPTTDARINLQSVSSVHAWASGQSFATIASMTDIPEGHLVRGLLQLNELLRHMCSACYHLGDQALSLQVKEAQNAINRDIICAPSLYISIDISDLDN